MAKLLVIGASKGIGLDVVRTALERGHTVRALARSADKIAIEHDNLEPVNGDATLPENVADALDGVDAVIVALGVPKDLNFILKPVHLFSDATRTLLPLMEEKGIKRLLVVTGFGAGEAAEKVSMLEKVPFKAILGRAYADKSVQEELIKQTALDWTIARPGVLTNGRKSGNYKVLTEKATWRNGVISRKDVADFLLNAFEQDTHIHEAPVLVR